MIKERLAWLIRLRWVALSGIVVAAALAAFGAFPGVNYQVLLATAAGAALYNASMWRELQAGALATGQRTAMVQALTDFLLLTIVLWAAGGLHSPFVSYYVFHVALVGILSGARATLLAGGVALGCAGLLWLTEIVPALRIGTWQPQGFWDPFAQVVAFVSTVGAVAYLVTHAVAEVHNRERALQLAERLASLGRVVQGVAHELNTPLATIRTLAADMVVTLPTLDTVGAEQRGALISDMKESAALIKDETGRLGRIAQELLAGGDLARLRVKGAVALAQVVTRANTLVFAGIRGGPAVELDKSLDGILLRCDQDRLAQVLVNLLQNAHDALRGQQGALVRVTAERRSDEVVDIRVEDNGPGVDASVLGRVFEPFTTTKPPGEGTGLGLYTSYMLVRAMHGSLRLLPRPSGGTVALLSLPEDKGSADAQTAS